MSALVSILIPCFNAERWIAQCIESALDQNWPTKEVVVVDDGSTDGSAEVVATFGDRVRFVRAEHQGGNATRNQLLRLAHGEWLQYLDADDYLLPGKVAGQMGAVAKSKHTVEVVYSPVIALDMNDGSEHEIAIQDEDIDVTFFRWGPLNTGGLLMRRDAVEKVGGWKEDQLCCQEHELLFRLRSAGTGFLLYNRAETVYRQHGTATVSKRDPLRTIHTRVELTDRMEEYLSAMDRLTPTHREALFASRMECARSAYRVDPGFAARLSRKAERAGRAWIYGSPALPLSYQIAVRFAGFGVTERLAAWARRQQTGEGLA